MSKESLTKHIWTSTIGLPKWKQSPIDLNHMHVLHEKLPPLYLDGHISSQKPMKMTNTGTTVKIELCTEHLARLYGGPLNAEYQFSDLQFRWGESNACGAEHSIEGIWFSMEAQAIHWNINYGSIDKCYEEDDGIVIISFLLQVVGCPNMMDNSNFSCINDNLPFIKMPNQYVELPAECLIWIKDAISEPGYYIYSGSLTTYPYPECVTWIVVPRPIRISAAQANAFRELHNYKTEHILRNYRSQQSIYQRKVFYATEDYYDCVD